MEEQRREVIAKGNGVLRAAYELTLNEHRVVVAALRRVPFRKPPDVYRYVEVTVDDLVPGEQRPMARRELRRTLVDSARRLVRRLIVFREGEEIVETRWVSEARYVPDSGSVLLRFSQLVCERLSALREQFTLLDVELLLTFRYVYSSRFYEWFAQWRSVVQEQGSKELVMAVEEIRERLKLGEKYSRGDDFRRNVVERAVGEVNALSEFVVSVEALKEFRRIVAYRFVIRQKPEAFDGGPGGR